MSGTDGRTRDGNINKIKQEISMIEPLLDMDGEWKASETSIDGHSSGIFHFLKHQGAIHRVRREYYPNDENGDYRAIWEWNPEMKEKLQAYVDSLSRFSDYLEDGCNHKTHMNNVDGHFECKVCGQEYTREEIKQIEL